MSTQTSKILPDYLMGEFLTWIKTDPQIKNWSYFEEFAFIKLGRAPTEYKDEESSKCKIEQKYYGGKRMKNSDKEELAKSCIAMLKEKGVATADITKVFSFGYRLASQEKKSSK